MIHLNYNEFRPGSIENSSIKNSKLSRTLKTNNSNYDVVESFSDKLKSELHKVNALQKFSADMTEKLVTGEVENVHDVMIAAEKANMALNLTVKTVGKMMEAYKEVQRMSF